MLWESHNLLFRGFLKSSEHQSLPCLFDSRFLQMFRTTPIFGMSRDHKKGTTDKASPFDLYVAPTTQKCDWLMLDSDESDDRPKLTGRKDKEIIGLRLIRFEMNTIKSLGRERSNGEALSVVPFLRLSPRQQLSRCQLSRGLFFLLRSQRTIRKQRDCS